MGDFSICFLEHLTGHPTKQSTFFFGVVRYFFYRHPERIPKELRGIARNLFLFIPYGSLPTFFFKIFAIFLARLNLIA